jgi:hypothetical protein
MTIKLWDTRMQNSAAALVASAESGSAAAHGGMVRAWGRRGLGEASKPGPRAPPAPPLPGPRLLGPTPAPSPPARPPAPWAPCPPRVTTPHTTAPPLPPLQVTCVDVADSEPLLVSSSMDNTVSAWDLRRIGVTPLVTPVMAVQVRPARAPIATGGGLLCGLRLPLSGAARPPAPAARAPQPAAHGRARAHNSRRRDAGLIKPPRAPRTCRWTRRRCSS